MIARALATGHCTLTSGAMVLKVETDRRGKVLGVTFAEATGRVRTVRAKVAVLAGGAIGCTLGGFLADWIVRRTGSRLSAQAPRREPTPNENLKSVEVLVRLLPRMGSGPLQPIA